MASSSPISSGSSAALSPSMCASPSYIALVLCAWDSMLWAVLALAKAISHWEAYWLYKPPWNCQMLVDRISNFIRIQIITMLVQPSCKTERTSKGASAFLVPDCWPFKSGIAVEFILQRCNFHMLISLEVNKSGLKPVKTSSDPSSGSLIWGWKKPADFRITHKILRVDYGILRVDYGKLRVEKLRVHYA